MSCGSQLQRRTLLPVLKILRSEHGDVLPIPVVHAKHPHGFPLGVGTARVVALGEGGGVPITVGWYRPSATGYSGLDESLTGEPGSRFSLSCKTSRRGSY
jgi:hypothetical protein